MEPTDLSVVYDAIFLKGKHGKIYKKCMRQMKDHSIV